MTDRTTIASADLSDGLPRLTPEGTSHEPKLGLIKPHGGSERMVRESAPPHYLEVVHKAHGLMAEIEERFNGIETDQRATTHVPSPFARVRATPADPARGRAGFSFVCRRVTHLPLARLQDALPSQLTMRHLAITCN